MQQRLGLRLPQLRPVLLIKGVPSPRRAGNASSLVDTLEAPSWGLFYLGGGHPVLPRGIAMVSLRWFVVTNPPASNFLQALQDAGSNPRQ